MSKQARAREFSEKERKRIYERDEGQCIFCTMHYKTSNALWQDIQIDGVMHYIPRSHNGLGVAENGALGCKYHHRMLDNSPNRKEMLEIFEDYLRGFYPDWNKKNLVYNKWAFLEVENGN